MTELQTLLRFEPYYKSVIWGGDKIAALKSLDLAGGSIGESWEISAVPGFESRVAEGVFKGITITELIRRYGSALVGRKVYERWGDTFPLLIKFIDARNDLSIQVHPDDEMAHALHGSHGKTEMWYVIDAEPGAAIYAGLTHEMEVRDFCSMASDGSIIGSVARFNASRGQFYYIPAGTVHAIGAGSLVAEIQETSDISYRIYDYGRVDSDGNCRPLHMEEARKALDMSSLSRGPLGVPDEENVNIIECDFFSVDYVRPREEHGQVVDFADSRDSFSVIMAVHGDLECGIGSQSFILPKGNTGLIPAAVEKFTVRSSRPFLVVSLPSYAKA